MKTIAISAPINFSSKKTLIESLDSIIAVKASIKFVSPALGSLNKILHDYSEKNGFEYEIINADWSKELNADVERDKRLIAYSDELIVFDDGCTNRINLLKKWAKEKNIPVFSISITPSEPIDNTEILFKDLSHITDKNEINATIEKFEIAKEQAIKEGQFEMAAIIRDKIRILSIK